MKRPLVWSALATTFLFLTSCISMIHRSVDRDDLDGVRTEVQTGVSLESTDYRDKTPLLLAAEQGRMGIVEYLVEAGAEIDATTDGMGQITALRYAISNDDFMMVDYLLKNGSNPNLANAQGWTPIMTAARVGNRDVIQRLLDAGAQVQVRTEDGLSPIRIASNYGWTDVVVWLTLLVEQQEASNSSDAS